MRRPRAAAPRIARTDPPDIRVDPPSAEEIAQTALIMEALRTSPRWPEIQQAFAPLVEDMTLGIEIFAKDVLDHNLNAAAATSALIGTGSWNKSNRPEIIKPDTLLEILKDDYGALTKRQVDLLAAAERFHAANPKIITTEVQAKASDFAVQFGKAIKAAEDAKDAAKEPLLALTTAAQGFFARIWNPLKLEKEKIEAKQTTFAKSERDRVLAEAKAEQDRLQAIADDAARAAAAAMDEGMDHDAGEALAKAADAAADWDAATDAAQAKPADVTRVYGTAAVSSLRVKWKIRPALNWREMLPVAYLMPDQGKLDNALAHAPKKKDGTPILEIAGAELYTDEKIGNRG